jgi:hypothetical protein
MDQVECAFLPAKRWPRHGLVGIGLVAVFWLLNWTLPGSRTHWGFFPLWLGYCLTVDALVYLRRGTSLLTRSRTRYLGLFCISAPVWWLFEALNWRLQNWQYIGAELFSPFLFWLWATLSFTTVIPAVFGTAELVTSFSWFKLLPRGPIIRPTALTTAAFFSAGLVMFTLMLAWPRLFFPFLWLSLYFVLEPINVWLGHRTLADWSQRGDWRPMLSLWTGVLIVAFFWEMWNYLSFPKWIYTIPWGSCCHLFEMPLLGYGGYLPFAMELVAVYYFVTGLLKKDRPAYLHLQPSE